MDFVDFDKFVFDVIELEYFEFVEYLNFSDIVFMLILVF